MGNWLPQGNWIGTESDWWNRGAGGDSGTTHGYDARFVPRGGVLRDVYDTVVQYDGSIKGRADRIDLLGPTAGGVTDTVTVGPNESAPWWHRVLSDPRVLTWIVVAAGALYLLGPLLELLAAVVGGDD